MTRTQEKIKDFVEPQVFDELSNIAADPALALAAYRFTDFTSDLLARWLDALADLPRGRGAARALAGTRGVGKSHTLAVFCALAGSEKLRAEVADAHVATSARRLMERRYTIVQVERGTRATLVEEMAAAFTKVFGGNDVQWGTDPAQMLAVAASRANDATLVVNIDTAFNRPARVRRDDGPQLSALKTVTAGINAFVALALDDDIAGADGANVALSGTYQIDYVDTEHLYRVVEQYLLRKSPHARDMLHEVYLSLRSNVTGFNWSEPRFASLYPVHPLVADVSAAVRLYAPSFAFLPFAAKASARALGRPALSLILLDEVFDNIESDLRKSDELNEAFESFDHLASKGLEKVPVMQRLQARLILKTLFVLSLDGRGATASELCAALLMSDETLGASASTYASDTLKVLATAATVGTLHRSAGDDGAEPRYRFQIGPAAALDAALDELGAQPPGDSSQSREQLRIVPRTLFADWPLTDEQDESAAGVNFHLTWRGSDRPGRIQLRPLDAQTAPEGVAPQGDGATRCPDWDVLMLEPGAEPESKVNTAGAGMGETDGVAVRVVWQPAVLTKEESLTLRRLHVLRTDAALASRFGETAGAATGTLAAQAERIWTRVYMNDSVLFVNGGRAQLSHRARAARTLGGVLAEALAPHYDKLYPEHPRFTETFGERDVSQLVETLFGGTESPERDVQRLCRAFALPLGLAAEDGEACTFEMGDESLAHPWNREVMTLAEGGDGEVVPLERVCQALRAEPYGLARESQHLVLAALVAQRRLELVTASGERISRRTPLRSIRWDEMTGIRRADVARYSAETLTGWARLLTGDAELPAASSAKGREAVRAALALWLDSWREMRVGESFDALPDTHLTTLLWKTNVRVRKGFGAAAEALGAVLAGKVSLEEGLERVSDAFGGSEGNFEFASRQLAELREFIAGYEGRERSRAYLITAEPTGIDEIEGVRRELLGLVEDPHGLLDHASRQRFDTLWREFHTRYVEHYARVHDKTVGAAREREWLATLRRTERWSQFEALSRLPVVSRNFMERVSELLRREADARCEFPVWELLETQSGCVCAFRLARVAALDALPQELDGTIARGLEVYRRTLALLSDHLAIALDALARKKDEEADVSRRARTLSTAFAQQSLPERFSRLDVQLIERALQRMAAPPPVRVGSPTGEYELLTREDLRARLGQWLDELPEQPVLIEVFAGERDAP